MKRAVAFVAGLIVAVGAGGYLLWRRDSSRVARAIEAQANVMLETFTRDRVSTLPDPVARYFRHALPEGQRHIRLARLAQEGQFLLNERWVPFTATQTFSGRPAGFIWDARISAAPMMPVFVRDSYVGGVGGMQASMFGLYPIVNQSGTAELNAGALMRYLAEAVWFPTTLLPGNGVTWTAVDDRSATASLTDHGITVALTFTFTSDGDIVEVYSPDRFREENGRYIPTPWRVRALGYDTQRGVRIMSPAEVEWVMPDGPKPYWRGTITRVEYE